MAGPQRTPWGRPLISDLVVGARAVVDAARSSGKFDFDRPIEGLRALDRYTVQLKLTDANYPVIQDMLGFVGAAAREVVDGRGRHSDTPRGHRPLPAA